MKVEIEVNGQVRDVTVDRVARSPGHFRIAWDGVVREVDARVIEQDRHGVQLSLVRRDGECASYQVRCVDTNRAGALSVHLDNVVIDAVVNGSRARGAGGSAGQGADGESRLTAPMPGKVVRVLAQPGDQVAAGQPLVVVEAMKMENELGAARAGTVKDVPVQEGMSVEVGRLLAVIE